MEKEKEKKNCSNVGDGLTDYKDLEDSAVNELEKRYRHAFIANLLGFVVELALAAAVVFLLVRQCT